MKKNIVFFLIEDRHAILYKKETLLLKNEWFCVRHCINYGPYGGEIRLPQWNMRKKIVNFYVKQRKIHKHFLEFVVLYM